jgi:microcystin degradation protein MlrC
MPGEMARSDPRPSARVTRGAGSGRHLASVLQEGRENANIDAALGFIWRISVYVSYALADLTRTGLSVPANCLTTAFSQRLSAAADAELMRRTT